MDKSKNQMLISGQDGSQTHHRCIASASRHHGTCLPILTVAVTGIEPVLTPYERVVIAIRPYRHIVDPNGFEPFHFSLEG